MRMRYLTCRRCGLKVKTEERLAVPWDEDGLVDQVKTLLPEGQAMALRDKGLTELPWAWLDSRLVPYGYIMHTVKSGDPKRLVVFRTRTDAERHLGGLSYGRYAQGHQLDRHGNG